MPITSQFPARDAAGTAPRAVTTWPQEPQSVSLARIALREALNGWGLADVADAAGLVLTELMTNVLRHARTSTGGIEVRYAPWAEGGVRLEVLDGDTAHQPRMRGADPEAGNGLGLRLVHDITGGRWGTETHPGEGKLVWANVPAS